MNSGNSVFSSIRKIQEWLTQGYAAAKSVNKLPDSRAPHAKWARAVVSILKNVVRHLPGRDASLRRMYTHGVPLKASANRRGENLAITIT